MSMNFLSDDEKWDFALFLKRITFNDVLDKVEPGTKEQEKSRAYWFLEIIGKVQKELADQGFAPR
jgi:hypothetical protein